MTTEREVFFTIELFNIPYLLVYKSTFYDQLNSKPIEYWRVSALKVTTEEGSNLLSSKELTMATEPQPTSRHLSTQH